MSIGFFVCYRKNINTYTLKSNESDTGLAVYGKKNSDEICLTYKLQLALFILQWCKVCSFFEVCSEKRWVCKI